MKKTGKLIAILLIVVIGVALAACAGNNDQPTQPTQPPAATQPTSPDEGTDPVLPEQVFQIGIIQLVEHPALDAARLGFLAAFEERGVAAEFDYQNAQRDIPTLSTIANRFVGNNVDLVLAIATPSVQAMATATDTIPIVGTAITSYEQAGVVYSNAAPGFNVTGASDMNPVEAQILMMLEFLPDLQTLGIVYSAAEANSVYQAELARGIAESLGLTVVTGTVTSAAEVQQNTLSIAGRVDAIWIPTDNTHADAIAIVGQVSLDTGVPIFPGESNMVMGGGIATLSVDYFELGRQSGMMAIEILLNGADPATMPIQFAQFYTPVVNGFMLEALGLTVPPQYADYIQFPE